jgi:hypothetical protein
MGLVDDEEGDSGAAEDLEGARLSEALRGDVEQPEASGGGVPEAVRGLAGGEVRVDLGRARDSPAPEAVDLVLHERDERRDDDGESGAEKSGELVAEGLAAACRQDAEGGPAGEEGFDEGALSRPELFVTEEAFQVVFERHYLKYSIGICCVKRVY